MTTTNFSKDLLDWFDQYGRKDLPWQQSPTAYHIWLSEIMLQQTQVSTVISYYQRFTQYYPDIHTLAKATVDDVLALWTGLGYYARARNLHKSAIIIAEKYHGKIPNNIDQLIALPGIGRSTAGAIMALAHHQTYPILDGNVKRVLARYYAISGWSGSKAVEQQLWQQAEQLLPKQRIANYIQAQMDLGATVCTRSKPQCNICPIQQNCLAFQQGNPTEYPSPKPKKVLPMRKIHWIVAQSSTGEILLQRRPNSGIWGGLWSFPEVKNTKNIKKTCESTFNLTASTIIKKPAIYHVFTHFKLNIYPHFIACEMPNSHIKENKKTVWYKINDALQLGLPAPVKSFLKSL